VAYQLDRFSRTRFSWRLALPALDLASCQAGFSTDWRQIVGMHFPHQREHAGSNDFSFMRLS
jgi:hypothetical protein